ncbi:AMP-dependent synthetase/ligase [Nocardia jinanensis]|uniref:AMP-binding protein n=1 Tax=Nocardia jinanensis TaxID=382504 RepID=A0A917VXP2_9NOCA|nr:AMP-binding protein [Nocardia jinanensis]GGL31208.1 AMP-binding protein [Nocardia jinanensis]
MVSSIPALLASHIRPDNSAPAQRFTSSGHWVQRSYAELWYLIGSTAAALRALGVRHGDRVAVQLRTRADWSVIDLAAATLGAPLVPIYPTSAPAQVLDIVERTRPVLLIVDALHIVPGLDAGGPAVVRVGAEDGDLGELAAGDDTGAAATPTVGPHDLYSISFTSGSAGKSKGCLLTHGNFAAVVTMAVAAETHPEYGLAHRDIAFVFLPLAHASARLQQLTTFAAGGELVYGHGDTARILEQIAQTGPTYVPGMPRLFESAYLRANRDPLVLRAMFGDRLIYALTGGAPIAPELLAAYAAAGIPLVEGYGSTETSTALTIATPHANRPGTVGRALPGVELRIAGDGEILARGPNMFAGYLDDPEATAQALRDDWFHTGDLGHLDSDGYLTVTGRKKNLIITSTGKNVAPEYAENIFRQTCRLDGVVVAGDNRPYLIALVLAGGHTVDDDELASAARLINSAVSPPERIRKIAVVDRALSRADGELTESGKTVRPTVLAHLRGVVDDIYQGTAPDSVRVIEIVRRPLRHAS